MKPGLIALAAVLGVASAAPAGVLWDEGVSGDASSDPAAPSNAGVVMLGSNTFVGDVSNEGGADQRDYITFEVPAGLEITQLIVVSFDPNNIAWTHFDDGATSVIPDAGNAGTLLAGAHIEAATPDGTNVFGNYQTGSPNLLAGPGLGATLGPGTYTFLMQQTSPILTSYELNFVAVPAPNVVPMGGLVLLARRRRR